MLKFGFVSAIWVNFGYEHVIDFAANHHGGSSAPKEFYLICVTNQPLAQSELEAVDVYDVVWKHVFVY